ncbi:MAG: type II secretion system protein [Candidatus Saccharibacteria bacterium]|nr:type II secretion system protein [Candidatus Saccharibacteria bacterium]
MTKGFTIVELMITLGIAGIFLLSGFQLYQVVQLRNTEAREMSEAGNVGYGVLRKEAQNHTAYLPVCSSSDPYPSIVSRTTTLPKPVRIEVRHCLPFTDAKVVKATVTVKYGQKGDSVVHATYIPRK